MSEEFKRVYDKVPVWIFTCENNPEWTMLETNSRIETVLGYTEEEFRSECDASIASVIPEPYKSKIIRTIAQLTKKEYGAFESYTTPVVRKNGIYTWLNVDLYWEEEDEHGIFYVSCTDVTELHDKYNEEISYQNEFEDEDVLLKTRVDLTTDRVETVYTTKVMTLPDQAKTFSAGVVQLSSRAYDEEERTSLLRKLSIPYMKEMVSTNPSYSFEYKRMDSYGHPSYAMVYVNVFVHPETSHIMAFVYLKDINDERKLSEVLRSVSSLETETIALMYLRSFDIEFLKLDNDLGYLKKSNNNTYQTILQRLENSENSDEENEAIRQKFSIEAIREHLSHSRVYEFTFSVNHGNRYKKSQFIYFDEKYEIVTYRGMDITNVIREEERQKQALKEAMLQAEAASKAKGIFLSQMSHEIRTPLNAVIGYLSMAKDAENDPTQVDHCIQKSQIAARNLLGIINDVLDISSIESGKMKIANDDFNLRKLLSDLTTVFYQQARLKGIAFQVNIHEVSEEWLVGDPLRVNQILMNLLSNAVKFTPSGGTITLRVDQKHVETKNVYLIFEVQDTGIGMSEEYQKRLFHPFEQADASTARKYGGSGLGLSITKNLVDRMGGTIQVVSVEGSGTCFTVSLHFVRSSHVQPTLPRKDFSKVRVLVVDDNKTDATYIRTLLKRCGVKADLASSGEDAIQQLKRRSGSDYAYDLCIMDWNMPGLDGIETTRQIREVLKDKLPIIIASAYDVSEFETQAKEAGVSMVISKPLFQSTMFDLLVNHFGSYEPEQSATTPMVSLAGTRLILAEDNEMNMEIALNTLTKAGISVTPVVNGQEAVDTFLASAPGTYDLILMDIQMPVLDGYAATRKIRSSKHPEGKTIPIIAMTANAFAEDVSEAMANGMNDHIAKPVDRDKLMNAIQKVSKQKEEPHAETN